jgi:hypothetical protein
MKISQPEHGGNGVRPVMVNQSLPLQPLMALGTALIYGSKLPDLSRVQTNCCIKSSVGADLRFRQMNLFDCASLQSFSARAGANRKFVMIGTVTAVMGLVSAAIFLAHAFEGYRYRA